MYKLREERLKALYDQVETPISAPSIGFIMDTNTNKFGLTAKSTVISGGSHGDSLADHSFESFKTKEIRDSESPTRFGTVIPSDNSGWHITTSEELSNDGKTHTVRSTATTEGTKDIKDGRTSFAGKNQEAHSERFDGDDKNFVHSKGDQSSTFLAENTVIEGDDGCKIQKKSSSVTTSSSRVIRSHHTSGDDTEFAPVKMSSANTGIQESKSQRTSATSSTREETASSSQCQEIDGNIASKPLSRDPDRVSEAFRLLEQPGQVLSKEVLMINPTTRQITITKKLDDGTTVTTRSFEKVGQHTATQQKTTSTASTSVSKSEIRRDSDAATFHNKDEIENRSTKRDISDKITNQKFILEERADRERTEQVDVQQNTTQQQKISVDMSAAHDSFARSLRCVSPTGSVRSVRSTSTTGRSSVSPDKSRRDRRSPSRDSDASRFSTHTTTRTSRSELSNRDYMKPTITSERKQSSFKETLVQESNLDETYDTADNTKQKERSASPKKVPQNTPDTTPRGPSPDKLSRHASPSKTPKDGSPFCSVDTSRAASPVKRDSSPVKMTSAKLVRENSSDAFNVDTTITISTSDKTQRQIREDVEVFDVRNQVTDLDDITVNVKLENVTDDIEVTTTVEEVDSEDKTTTKKTTGKQKPPLVRSETFEERCRKILGMNDKTDSVDKVEENKSSIFSTYDNTITRTSEMREKRKKIEQEVKTIESEVMKSARKASEFIDTERRTSTKNVSPTRRASETPKEKSPVRKNSQGPSTPKSVSPVRKYSQSSPERRPSQTVKESSPVRKYSQPSPERRPKEEPSVVINQSPDRRPKEQSPVRKLSEATPHRCSRSHDRSPTPTEKSPSRKTSAVPQDKSPVRNVPKSPIRKSSNTESTVIKSTSISKADILVSQKQEGKNLSVTEITIQPVIETKKSDKILTKQTSDNRFERRSTSSKVVTNKSSSDFDVKRKAVLDKTESVSDRTSRVASKPRTPATSPDKRRPQDSSPTKMDKTKNHITVAKIKIEPVRKPIQAKVFVEDRSNRATTKSTKTTRKFVEDLVVESDKDTGISENEYDDDVVTTVKTTTTTVTTTKKHPVTERKDSGPMNKATSSKFTSRLSNENILKTNNVASSTTKRSSITSKTSSTANATSTTSKKTDRPVKCITTKTINLSAKPMIESDNLDNVVIDIQQAKSSREPTPNKLVPIPVSPEEDTGKPRFPDAVQEPDDEPKPAPKVNNIKIFEEATNDYVGCEITEVEDHEVRAARATRITNLDRVTEDDESLLSVTEKVSKFAEEAARLKEVGSKTPNRFVRHEFDDLDEHLKSDECLLSVSDKVTKFISTAEEVKKIKTSGPFVPECKVTVDVAESDECLLSVNDKISKFANTSVNTEVSSSTVSVSVDDVDRSMVVVDDDSLLSVSEKKKKFISAAGTPQKSPELVKNVMKQTTRHERTLDEEMEGDQKATITDRYTTATLTKPRDKVPQSVGLRSTEAIKKAKQIFENGNKAASAELAKQKDILNRPSVWEDRRKKEQSTVEEKQQVVVAQEKSQKDVKLTDIGVYKKTEEVETKDASKGRRDSGTKAPAYIRDTVSNKKDMFEKRISSSKLETSEVSKTKSVQEDSISNGKRSSITEKYERSISKENAPAGNKPSYMSHTVCSLEHINTGRRESMDNTQRSVKVEEQIHEKQQQQEVSKTSSKFGVELKRMDSGRNVVSNTSSSITATTRRKSSVDATAIEEIFNLETLEKMLEAVTGYEQRRRIRAQIRLVKKMGEKPGASTVTTTTTTTTMKMNGRVRDASPKRKVETSPTRVARKASQDTDIKVVEKHSESAQRSASPSKVKPITNGKAITTTTSTVTTKTSKLVEKVPPKDVVKEDKPIWATTNILKKPSETTRSFKTNTAASTSRKTTTMSSMRDVPKESKPTDCITSSYGVGPTDENGLPLFGIRALKKKPAASTSDVETTSKVSGSFMSETLYSENGGPAVGERKTMMYSSDAKDFDDLNLEGGKRKLSDVREKLLERENSRKGLISVTKTEKISNGGSHVTTEVGILDDGAPREGKVVRKGSVKELTERFVHKESSSSLLSEKSYPKAGLILRSTHSHSSRSSTPCEVSSVRSGSVEFDENDMELRSTGSRSTVRESLVTSSWSGDQQDETEDGVVFRKSQSSSSRQTRSFLNDGSRVSGVQDVLERMRNADNVEESGDSVEDREARALLNKFLGASVLMSGMESMVASSAKEESSFEGSSMPGSKTVSKVTTTRTVKSTASSSGPKASVDNLEQIWDESVLKQLLESSTNYEERRKIRARLRQIMAEKEACADIVASVTADLQRERQLQHQKSNDSGSNSIQGESLLLPLLQGILLHNKPGSVGGGQIPGQSTISNGTTGGARLSIPPVEDSGTESGEDLRLLAAGLHDNIEMYRGLGVGTSSSNVSGDGSSISNGRPQDQNGDSVLHEVTAALQRLQLSLRDGKNINLETNKRNALLTLVCRLQMGLMQPDKLPEQISPVEELIDDKDDKVDYNQARRGSARFAKRRNRNNRHTVGVSREELADARRFIEEIGRMSSHSHSATPEISKVPEIPPASHVLKKQQSLGTVLPSNPVPSVAPATTFAMKRPSQFVPKEVPAPLKPALKSAEPAPTPASRKSKQKLLRQSQSLDQPTINGHELNASHHKPIDMKPLQSSTKVDPFKKPTQTAAQRALVKKYSFNDGSTSDEDEPQKNAEQVVLQKNTPKNTTVINTVQKIVNREVKQEPPKFTTSARKSEAREAVHSGGEGNKPLNKYTSKKLRMKRANTIDLPKNLLSNGAPSDEDSEDERRSRERPREVKAKTPVKPVVEVPDFKPKTENDLKFMAFIQKQNQPAKQVWNSSLKDSHGSHNWTSKFDHLKKNFESTEKLNQVGSSVKTSSKTSAMNFWKKAESSSFDEPPVAPPRRDASRPPKPISQLQSNSVASKAPVQPKLPPKSTGTFYQPPPLPAKPKPATQSVPRSPAQSQPVPKPPTVMSPPAQFTHAPTSAFKPIPKKLPPANLDFKPVHQEPEIIKPIPANISNGIVKQIVASGFKETPEVKSEQPNIQLGLVKSIAAAGFHETPFVPAPKLERTPTQLVLNYQAVPERAESPPPAAPWAGKKQSEGNSRVANIASSRFAANQFGLQKGALPTQPQLTYQGSLKYPEKPLSFQLPERSQEKRPSLPDVGGFKPPPPKQEFISFTSTDYTQPKSISTFTLNRSDSLTNPDNQPLVLTSTNSIYSPSNVQYAPQHLGHQTQLNYLSVNDQYSSASLSPNCVDEDDIDSMDSQEMRVVTRVMQAPVSQLASYSSNKPSQLGSSTEGRGSLMAQSLQGSLKKIQQKSPTPPKRHVPVPKHIEETGSAYIQQQSYQPGISFNQPKPHIVPTVEVTPHTPIAAKPQPQFTVPSHAIFNNVHGNPQNRSVYEPPRLAPLARTDSWVRLNQQQTMPNSLMRAKSSHTLAVPQTVNGSYDGPPSQITDKQRTVEAYFAGSQSSLNPLARTASNTNILRDKSGMTQNSVRPVSYAMGHSYNPAQYNIMSSHPSDRSGYLPQQLYGNSSIHQRIPPQSQHQYYQPPLGGGLSRSRTMPHIPLNNLSLLDEDNIEDAFEELMSQSFAV